MKFCPAPDVAEIAADLIDTVSDHEPLDGFRIVYLFIDKAPRSNGRTVLGTARVITGRAAFLSRRRGDEIDDFDDAKSYGLIEISHNTWLGLTDAQRVALVDHELCHFHVHYPDEGPATLATNGHDVEEFVGIIRRHGLWKSDLQEIGAAVFDQLSLDLGTGAEDFLRSLDDDDTLAHTTIVAATNVDTTAAAMVSTPTEVTAVTVERDPLYNDARTLVVDRQTASARMLYSSLGIGKARANLILDQLETAGVVGPNRPGNPAGREVIERWGNE